MIRTVTASIAAVVALGVSLGYFYVLNDGYAQPTDIAGTLYRFAGSTVTVLLVAAALLVAFPALLGTRMRRIAAAMGLVGWVLIELGSMAFSLMYDYLHLNQSSDVWSVLQAVFFIGGYVLLAAGLALYLVRARQPTSAWIAGSVVLGILCIALLLVVALFVRYFLFAVPIAALVAIILVAILRRRRPAVAVAN